MNAANDLLDIDGFRDVLVERLGEHAPTLHTLRTWNKPTIQARDPFLRAHMPPPLRMRGEARHLYRRADCEGLATAILSEARAGDAA